MIRRGIGVQSFVSAGVPTDADAQAFITAAGITDVTQQSAINTLVTDLKGYGIWTKMKAIYPFVGGTSSAHKWNLKDPRDLDAAFRLVFSGGATHSSTGWLPNGTNGYGDTKLSPLSSLTLNSSSLSYYVRNNSQYDGRIGLTAQIGNNGIEMGFRLVSLSDKLFGIIGTDSSYIMQFTNTDSRGFYTLKRTSSTDQEIFKNGVSVVNNTVAASGSFRSGNVFLGARNLSGSANLYDNHECAFASIGDGLTDTEAANLYTAVQAYQTTLGRQV